MMASLMFVYLVSSVSTKDLAVESVVADWPSFGTQISASCFSNAFPHAQQPPAQTVDRTQFPMKYISPNLNYINSKDGNTRFEATFVDENDVVSAE